jgi:hypothetical protein
MALQDIDSVNLPAITAPDITVPITLFGDRYHTSAYTNSDVYVSNSQIQGYGERSSFSFYPHTYPTSSHAHPDLFKPQAEYISARSFFRLFIGNYATVSSFKLIFKLLDSNMFTTNGGQHTGYTPGAETRLVLFESPVDIKTTVVWSTYLNIIPTANLIDSTTVVGDVVTITFNALGRTAITGVSSGYVDFGCWIPPSSIIPSPVTGYCLTTSYDDTAKLEITT